MLNKAVETKDASPFHAGEREFQTRTGKREAMENLGRRAIRPFMPDQHRDFFAQLPFVVAGAIDEKGWPWASLLPGRPGFMQSPDSTTLDIASMGAIGDPVRNAIKPGAPLGLLGIELQTRRRNRLNGRVSGFAEDGFSLAVDQSFGNCPKYIQRRDMELVREPGTPGRSSEAEKFAQLDERARALIRAADTFFVSSYIQTGDNPVIEGVDVSHRGGRRGFVKVDGDTLTIPDFPGNYLFNTLGNFFLNPKAGLVFIDFATGDLLMLTGTVELLTEDHEDVAGFKGAQRGWRFILDHGLRLGDTLPFRSTLGDISPNNLVTDTWQDSEARQVAEAKRQA